MDMMMTGRTQEEVGIRPGFLVVVSVIKYLSYICEGRCQRHFDLYTPAHGRVVGMNDEGET